MRYYENWGYKSIHDGNSDLDPEQKKPMFQLDKRLFNRFENERLRIQKYIGANVNYNKDYQDDNHKYNYLRDRILEQRKR